MLLENIVLLYPIDNLCYTHFYKINKRLKLSKVKNQTKILLIQVLYMSFDKFLLAVESHDLSQADKSIIRVSSFPKLCNG